jgi:hypothetical protein
VVFPDPVAMKFTGDLNDHLQTIEGNKPGLREPGIVTLAGHFAFNQKKYLFPNLCQIHTLTSNNHCGYKHAYPHMLITKKTLYYQ